MKKAYIQFLSEHKKITAVRFHLYFIIIMTGVRYNNERKKKKKV